MNTPVFVKVSRCKQKTKVRTKILFLSDWDIFEEEEVKTTVKTKLKK